MNGSTGGNSRQTAACFVMLLIGLIFVGLPLQSAAASKGSYVYDVTPGGLVKVTIHPGDATKLGIPPTAENVKETDLTFTSKTDWELFARNLKLSRVGSQAKLTYDWPDGALPWPVKTSEWMQGSEYKWCTDNFYTEGPADVTIILPEGAEALEYRENCTEILPPTSTTKPKTGKCAYKTETGPDGRVRVIYDVPAGFRASWLGVVYRYPWAEKYTRYGKSPLPCYYPTVLGKYPEFMSKLEAFYKANEEFYQNYKQRMGYVPPHDIGIYVISWVHGYGGAYTAGDGTYYNYRRMPAFEWPPIKDGGNLMGAYHEMSHAFQPICAPDFFGGHVWSAYWTLDYDYNSFPTPDVVAKRKASGIPREDYLNRAYALFQKMTEKKAVPGLWYKWSDDVNTFPGMEDFRRGHDEMQELACAYVLLELEKELGAEFYGKYYKLCVETHASADVEEPMQQKVVAMLMSKAAGRDLIPLLEKLTGCDLRVKLTESSENLIKNGGMESEGTWKLDAWQPDAKMTYDDKVYHSGKKSLRLDCPNPNDAHVDQLVKLKPKTQYFLIGWIKTEKVGNGDSGAMLAVFPDNGRQLVTGTEDWHRIVLPVYSGDTGEINIGLRLGYFSQPTAGTAWIDDLELIPIYSEKGWSQLVGTDNRK